TRTRRRGNDGGAAPPGSGGPPSPRARSAPGVAVALLDFAPLLAIGREGEEGVDDTGDDVGAGAPGRTKEVVGGAFDGQQRRSRLDQAARRLDLVERAERIARAVREEGRRPELGQVRRAQLRALPRRMERIGQEQQRVDQPGIARRLHDSLALYV